jgi:hypothetical protein
MSVARPLGSGGGQFARRPRFNEHAEGIGKNKARAIYDNLKANADVIDRLAKAGV